MPSKPILAIVISSLCFGVTLSAQENPGGTVQQKHKPLNNVDIITMVQRQFDDDTVMTVIGVSDTNFDTSVEALTELKKAGVSERIIRVMLSAKRRQQNAESASKAAESSASTPMPSSPRRGGEVAAPAPAKGSSTPDKPAASSPSSTAEPAAPSDTGSEMQAQVARMAELATSGMFSIIPPEQMPRVFIVTASPKQEITASTAQIAQTNYKGGETPQGATLLRSLASMSLRFAAVGAGPAGMMAMSAFSMGNRFMPGSRRGAPTMTYVWGLPGRQASRGLAAATPTFELTFGDVPGVDPDEYEPAIVKLVQTKDNYRLVGATHAKMRSMMSAGGGESKWVSEDRWPVRLEKKERGHYLLHVDQAFEPGEYAVVLHPPKGHTAQPSAFSGGGFGGFGAGPQLFYSAWDFGVLSAPLNSANSK